MTNQYTDKTRMLKALRNSRTLKEKAKWSRETGAGFILEDIERIELNDRHEIKIYFKWSDSTSWIRTIDLNLRETEEAIKFLEPKKLYCVKGNYGQGWEIVYNTENRQDALDRLKEYNENEKQYAHKLGWTYE